MRNKLRALALSAAFVPLVAAQAEPPKDDVAWNIVAGLTTDVGPRLAGSEAEARARAWASEKLKALGFPMSRSSRFPSAAMCAAWIARGW
jgi:hypothetical protein